MRIKLGPRDLTFPGVDVGELRDSGPLISSSSSSPDDDDDDYDSSNGGMDAIRRRMDEDGYVLLRGLIDRDTVLEAREAVLAHVAEVESESKSGAIAKNPEEDDDDGDAPDPNQPPRVRQRRKDAPFMEGRDGIASHPSVLRVVESPRLFEFFRSYFDGPAQTFDYKWLRGVGTDGFTGAHCDVVYMGRGSSNVHTAWIPLGDVDVERGTLAVCRGSHRLPSFDRLHDTYGRLDVDRDETEGWFTTDPMEVVEKFGGGGCQWLTGPFRAGDVIIFGMRTVHASTTNLTDDLRLSCDVRFQPSSEPVDERWVGDGVGHTAHGVKKLRSMEEARAEWGI